jgi:hypothetical protein
LIRFYKKTFFLLLSFSFLIQISIAQEQLQQNTWTAVFADYKLDSLSSVRLELHYRTRDFFGGLEQTIVRPSYVRKINKWISLSGGYSYLGNVIAGKTLTENNLWEQVFFSVPLQNTAFFGWIRAEQRWMENTIGDINYAGRLRFRMGVRHPLFNLKNESVELIVFDELFMITKDLLPHTFNQNWTFIGFRARLVANAVLVSGYQRNTLAKCDNRVHINIWSSILFITL